MTDPKPVTGALLVLDADVLYPIRACDFILTIASLKIVARPVATATILDEAARNARANRPDPESSGRITKRFDAVRTVVDGHDAPVPIRYHGASLINPKDQHVLAAALHHRADFVVTNDKRLRREITTWLDQHGQRRQLAAAISADDLAARLLAETPTGVETAIREMASRFRNPPRTYAEVVASLAKSMPSLGQLGNG